MDLYRSFEEPGISYERKTQMSSVGIVAIYAVYDGNLFKFLLNKFLSPISRRLKIAYEHNRPGTSQVKSFEYETFKQKSEVALTKKSQSNILAGEAKVSIGSSLKQIWSASSHR